MNLDDASKLAVNLMYLHGLTPEWGFKFDRAGKRQGQCDYLNKTISISAKWTVERNAEWVTQVMLHEIAHAKCGNRAGHGKVWRAYATMIGYKHDEPEKAFVKGESVIFDTPTMPEYDGRVGTVVKVNRVNIKLELDGTVYNVGKGLVKPLTTSVA